VASYCECGDEPPGSCATELSFLPTVNNLNTSDPKNNYFRISCHLSRFPVKALEA
jgi:hypothetical protein